MVETNIKRKKIHVLKMILAPAMGGIENQSLAFLQRYDRDRLLVDIACSASTEGVLREKYLATGTRLILCRWSRYIFPYFWRLIKLFKQENYDVIHTHSSEVSGIVILAAWLAGIPIRIASYDHIKTYWRNPNLLNRIAVNILQKITRRWSTKIYGDAEICLDVYYPDWKEHPEKFQICYDGIDVTNFYQEDFRLKVRDELKVPADSLVVGHVGRFSEVKNHKTIVEVAEIIAKRFDKIYFLLVGDGALRQHIEKEVERRNLKTKFIFTGNRGDVPRLLNAMDIFVMPSLDEGFGLAVAEAEAVGLPVVASDIPGIKEALCPSMHEFCCEPLDVEGFCKGVTLLLNTLALRKKLGSEGQAYVRSKFSIERMVGQWENAYLANQNHFV